ncbi:hypothetical protein VTJ49DRAFT_2085 [Mycothermus thermophilus]|uniref:Origin recognition complex subunit 5 n=1 Tax=Humicola insolens TaxID=85995 RepID=A0ABR3VAY6_HUMIN
MIASLFQLPDELIISTLAQAFPCREAQIRALATLLCQPTAAPCRNLVVYGTEATGKTAITSALLARLADQDNDNEPPNLRYAIVSSPECITARHLYETVVAKVAVALEWTDSPSRCESLSQLHVELCKMLKYPSRPPGFRFVLVLDAIDRQREAPHTLLPALARLSEIIPCLTTVFIVTAPAPNLLLISSVPHLHFPTYIKPEFVAILSARSPPGPNPLPNATPQETADLWARFVAAVHDALARAACRTLPALSHSCTTLWPRFTSPVLAGTHSAKEFSKLLVAARLLFHDDRLLDPGVLAIPPSQPTSKAAGAPPPRPPPSAETKPSSAPAAPPPVPSTPSRSAPTTPATPAAALTTTTGAGAGPALARLLPTTARHLLLAAYLASHNPARHDLTLFSTHHHGRRRRRGGLSVSGGGRGGSRAAAANKHKKIARKLLGAHAFVLERMLAIFEAVRGEWGDGKDGVEVPSDGDVGMAIATLASLRLLVKVGGGSGGSGDMMDSGGKWRVNVGWEVIRGLGRAAGVEIEEWLIE